MTIGIIGCGFWAHYQVAAWRQADSTVNFAFCDQALEKAQKMADMFQNSGVYDDVDAMLAAENLDLIDIITPPASHAAITKRVVSMGIPIICQKPMASSLVEAEEMVEVCARHKVPFFIHENFRWQIPIRRLKEKIEKGVIGVPFRARVYFNSGFPVFENQPELATLDKFILADLGVHLLDVCRFLFGEASSIYCQAQRVNHHILGEDVATILLKMVSGMTCTVELSYASTVEYECFPQTLFEVEGDKGSIRLQPDYVFSTTTKEGTFMERTSLPDYPWVHAQYAVVQSAMVAIHEDFLGAVRNNRPAETTGEDNVKTLRLMHAAYESVETDQVITLPNF